MEILLKEVLETDASLAAIKERKVVLPASLSYTLGYNRKQIRPHVETYQETYKDTVKKYAELDEAGELKMTTAADRLPEEQRKEVLAAAEVLKRYGLRPNIGQDVIWKENGEKEFNKEISDFLKDEKVSVDLRMIKLDAFKVKKGKVDAPEEEEALLTWDEMEGLLIMIEEK